ncbi:hypothetical protein [Peribacillus kribbensis]|uniref:hypothetical protein n=1 Tax=Peribacillus kribbensis TaxID=356658 RepID=UPI000425DCF6|nr:hypothetical protein [Peribacillus kribbensis]
MDIIKIKKLLEDLACSPYCESHVSHTLQHNHKKMIEISYEEHDRLYQLFMIESQSKQYYHDLNSAAAAISAVIDKELLNLHHFQ